MLQRRMRRQHHSRRKWQDTEPDSDIHAAYSNLGSSKLTSRRYGLGQTPEAYRCVSLCVLYRKIRLVFQVATCRIKVAGPRARHVGVQVPGTEIVPISLADALDGSCTEDYHQRVEPSVVGGQKMARLILQSLGWPCDTQRFRYEAP